ncbi:MAG: hypothetical protein EA356_06860 [Geminicoccaceae bacterium]|nr:MAG: hypothetical protein EA356_06860 [Geminicoccaceae bacterium]
MPNELASLQQRGSAVSDAPSISTALMPGRSAAPWLSAVAALAVLTSGGSAAAADDIPIGQLVAETGATAPVATVYGQGIADAIAFINTQGGIDGRPLRLETVDYG